jgi:DNA-directed RNA polymerase subunit N
MVDKMIIPIRCFTCGKVIASYYEQYVQQMESGEEPKKILDDLGLKRYCCRRMLVSHIDLIDEALPFG